MNTEPPILEDNIVSQLREFTRAVWGRSNHVLVTHPELNVEYIDLGIYLRAFQRLFPTAVMDYDKILVRQEYRDALRTLKEDMAYHRGAYVTGQPGIGKTLFLIYMLVVSLGEMRPVALEFPDGRPFYALFQESGFTTHSLHGILPAINNLSNFMWALSDSNYQIRSPSSIFLSRPGKIRVIQTTSPREDRWLKRWSREARTECYIMDIWTLKEIRTLANLLNLDVNRMTSLGKTWGCDPRSLLDFIEKGHTDMQIEKLYRTSAPAAVKRSEDMLLAIEQNALFADAPSRFYFCRPSISGSQVDRTIPRAVVPTKTICRVLGEALQEYDNRNVRLTFFRALSRHSETRSAAGYLYEHLFHCYFAAGKPIVCKWTQPRKRSTEAIQLTDLSNVIPPTWTALTTGEPPFFWVAPKGAPGIDSVLVLEKHILVFQLTISSKHGSLIDGMRKVREYLPPRLRDIPWKVVFVGQESTTASSVANDWAGKLFFPIQKTERVHIAWAEVDPVVKGVQYMVFHHGEQDSDVESDDGQGVVRESSSKGKKRAIGEVAEPEEAPKASSSRTT